MSDPATTYLDDRHVYVWEEIESTQIVFERFSEERDGTLRTELTVTTNLPNGGHLLGPSRINLLSDRTIKTTANALKDRNDMADWYALLTQAAKASVEYWRDGDPLELVDTNADTRRRWLLEPFLEDSGFSVIFARGGSGKSFLGGAIALAQATGLPLFGFESVAPGPVAYLDWEASKSEFDSRMTRLCRPLGVTDPEIYYRHQDASLASTAHTLSKRFAQMGVTLCIVDSKGMAISGAPEKSEPILELNRAMRRLKVPILLIDHVSKGQIKGDDPDMAFGSVYIEYQARLAWSVKSEARPGEIKLLLKNTKANNGPKRTRPLGVTFAFEDRGIAVSVDHQPAIFTDKGPAKHQIAEYLVERGPTDLGEIARDLRLNRDTAKKALERDEGEMFERAYPGTDIWQMAEVSESLPDPM